MAPAPVEQREHFITRLRAHAAAHNTHPLRFGAPHFTHAVCFDADGWLRVRRLEVSAERIEAFKQEHQRFMPEDAERIAQPTGPVELEAATLERLISAFESRAWPHFWVTLTAPPSP